MGPNIEGVDLGKSGSIILRCDGERKTSSEAADFTLTRKASTEIEGARTANRHR